MTLPAPTYDLILMLDTQSDAGAREKIVADARAAIQAQGELVRDDAWGMRALAYQIDHKADAEYHLLQFHASTPELLRGLERSLRIADEVVRFRIVKLKPGTPEAPDMKSGALPSRSEPTPEAPSAPEAVVEVEAVVEAVEVEAVVEAAEPAQAG
jgi:small subunit ribosomal protein S6